MFFEGKLSAANGSVFMTFITIQQRGEIQANKTRASPDLDSMLWELSVKWFSFWKQRKVDSGTPTRLPVSVRHRYLARPHDQVYMYNLFSQTVYLHSKTQL